jgi:hypothetical protein
MSQEFYRAGLTIEYIIPLSQAASMSGLGLEEGAASGGRPGSGRQAI